MGDLIGIREFPNYTGPGISDGKFQESVEFGSAKPKDDLDALARLHDTAYAKYKDKGHRRAADQWFADEAAKIPNSAAMLAGGLVRYGNQVKGSAENILERMGEFAFLGGLPGLIVGGVENMLDLHDTLINGAKYRKEVESYFKMDPLPEYQLGGSKKYDTVYNIPKTPYGVNSVMSDGLKLPTIGLQDLQNLTQEYAPKWEAAKVMREAAAALKAKFSGKVEKGYEYTPKTPKLPDLSNDDGLVRQYRNGVADMTDRNGNSLFAYQPRRKKKKRKNRVHADF